MTTTEPVTDTPTASRLAPWGGALVLVGLLVGALMWNDTTGSTAARIAVVLPAAGVLLIAGCVLVAAGAIVDAIRRR